MRYATFSRVVLFPLVAFAAGGSHAASFDRRDIKFASQGVECAAWFYIPKDLKANEKRPAIVMAHGWSAVKDHLDRYAARFAEAGFTVLSFDYRYLGASKGEPRGQVFYRDQQEDYRNAITWVSNQKEVDATRIGIWGTSYSGGHVLVLGAFDKRVKAVVSQVPAVNSWDAYYQPLKPEDLAGEFSLYEKARNDFFGTGNVNYVPVVAPEGQYSSIPVKEAHDWFIANLQPIATWKNQITVSSLEDSMDYDPTSAVHLIAPTPLLMIITDNDIITPTELEKKAFERAKDPKKLVVIPGGHFEVYQGPKLEQAVSEATDWFKRWLMK
jgi:fermentation-respiration switch protein FrsA (DUF1100 family)